MQLKRALDLLVYLVVRVLICFVQAVRLETCHALAGKLATLFCDVLKIRQAVIDDNLRHAYPHLTPAERHRLAWRMWEHLLLMVAEVAHARRTIHITNWHRHFTFVRSKHHLRVLLDSRPTILVSGHYGNFELGGYLMGLFGFPTYSIARPLDNPYLDRWITQFRSEKGQYMLPKEGSAKQIAALLERGATLGVLGDQAAGPKGCWVQFFGRPASAHKAIAVFSLASGGPLMVTYARRLGGPLIYEFARAALADPADPDYNLDSVPALTQWYSDCLEEIINGAPEQYWWLHRRWKGQPPQRARKKKAA